MKKLGSQISIVVNARRGGINTSFSHNDAWNLAHYGMTKAEAARIERALTDEYGQLWPGRVNADVVQRVGKRLK